jgi:hypothetical protein
MDDVDGADPYAVSLGYFKRERASVSGDRHLMHR